MKCLQIGYQDEMKEHTSSWTDKVRMWASNITDSQEWKFTAILVTYKVGNKVRLLTWNFHTTSLRTGDYKITRSYTKTSRIIRSKQIDLNEWDNSMQSLW
jgi:hypothetical protein